MFQPGANIYTQGSGSRPEGVEVPHIEKRNPSPSDVNYPIGKTWLNQATNSQFILYSFNSFNGVTSANWDTVSTPSGGLDSLSDGTTKVFPDGTGNISILGNGQVIVTSNPGSNDLELSLAGELSLGDVVINGSLNAEGNVEIHQQLTVDGPLVAQSSTSLNDGLTVSGNTILNNDLSVDGQVHVTGGTELNDGLTLNGPTIIEGNTTINRTTNGSLNLGGGAGSTLSLDSFASFTSGLNLSSVFVGSGNTPYNATINDSFFICMTGVPLVINLFNITADGALVVVSDTSGAASMSNPITINAPLGQNIIVKGGSPSPSITIDQAFGSFTFLTASSNYYVISQG